MYMYISFSLYFQCFLQLIGQPHVHTYNTTTRRVWSKLLANHGSHICSKDNSEMMQCDLSLGFLGNTNTILVRRRA